MFQTIIIRGQSPRYLPGYDGFGDHSLYYFEHTKTGLFFLIANQSKDKVIHTNIDNMCFDI